MSIPKNLFLFCHSWDSLPPEFNNSIKNIEEKNPNWNIEKHDDKTIIKIINDTNIFPIHLYENNSIPASRCDIARLILLYLYGGIYSDLSYDYIKPLDDIFDLNKDIVLLQRDDFKEYIGKEGKAHFTNGVLGTYKNSAYFLELIESVIKNLKKPEMNCDVINATGPGIINKSINNSPNNKQIISFKKSYRDVFNLVRKANFSNSWKIKQKLGIYRKFNGQRRIILHVGAHKTGTTTIQRDLYLNRDKLKTKGILYPKFPDCFANHSVPIYSLFTDSPEKFHANVLMGRTDKIALDNFHRKLYERFVDLSLDETWHTLILSGENISVLDKNQLDHLNKFILDIFGNNTDIDVYYCIRSPISYHISAIQERAKGSTLNSIFKDMNSFSNFFSNNITKLNAIFGKNNIHIINFDEIIKENNITLNFIRECKLEKVSINKIEKSANSSMSYESVILMDCINKNFPVIVNGILNKKRNSLNLDMLQKINGMKYIPTKEIIDKILQKIESDSILFKEMFGYNAPTPSFEIKNTWSNESLIDISEYLKTQSIESIEVIINGLRDEAIKIEKVEPRISLRLFLFCKKYRPNGPLINNKIKLLSCLN